MTEEVSKAEEQKVQYVSLTAEKEGHTYRFFAPVGVSSIEAFEAAMDITKQLFIYSVEKASLMNKTEDKKEEIKE